MLKFHSLEVIDTFAFFSSLLFPSILFVWNPPSPQVLKRKNEIKQNKIGSGIGGKKGSEEESNEEKEGRKEESNEEKEGRKEGRKL